MILIADLSVPSGAVPLGSAMEAVPSVEIELERLASLRNGVTALFWVATDPETPIEETVREIASTDPPADSVRQVSTTASRALLECRWNSAPGGLVGTLLDSDATLLRGEGGRDVWDFRLQFRSRRSLGEFQTACDEHDIPVTVRRVYRPSIPETNGHLTQTQQEALVAAYTEGYFEVPRATSMDELAAEFDISNSALSQRLRRGTATLVAETLGPE